jgi:uncharacterized protein
MSTTNAFTTHGVFGWNELVTPDPARAASFYAEVFGWTCTPIKVGHADYIEVKNQGESVAGICAQPVGLPSGVRSQGWGSYVTVANADAIAAKVVAQGGGIVTKQLVPGVGTIVVFRDPMGGHLAVIEYHRA